MKKEFVILSKAWYAHANQKPEIVDEICFSIDDEAEMLMVWRRLGNDIVPQLTAFDDSWKMFSLCPELFGSLAELKSQNISVVRFASLLVQCGFKDVTPTENPYDAPRRTTTDRKAR